MFIAAHSTRVPAAELDSLFLCVQYLLDTPSVNSQTNSQQHLQVYWSVSSLIGQSQPRSSFIGQYQPRSSLIGQPQLSSTCIISYVFVDYCS